MGQKARSASRRIGILSLLTGLFVAATLLSATPVTAAAGINQEMNFQGRLLNAQGATVPDGYYNIEFKIYQDGDGQTAGDTTGTPAGSLKWTEDWLNSNSQGVEVVNGFMSVQLGSITPFGSNVNWNSDTLWLSMQVGNTTSCTISTDFHTDCGGDGEMTPMKRLSSTPYAMNAGLLGGLSSASFLQIGQGLQTDASTGVSSIYLNKTGTGNLIDLQSNGTDSFVVNNSGDLTFGNNADHTLSVSTAAAGNAGNQLTISAGAAGTGGSALAGGNLVLQGGAGGGTNGNGGDVTIDGGVKNATGSDGSIYIGTNHATNIQLGSTTASSGTQTITIGTNNTAGSTTNVTIGSGSSAAGGTTTVQSKGTLALGNAVSPTVNVEAGNGGTINIGEVGSSATANTVHIGDTTGAAQNVTIGSATGASNTTLQGGTGNINLLTNSSSAGVIVKTSTNSATGFQVQDTSSNPLLTANTANGLVQIGSATANTNQNLFVLNNFSSATDPTNGTNGAMYYNTSTNSFRCYVNGAWSDCSGAQGSFVNLQATSPGTAQTGNFNIGIGTGILGTLESQASTALTITANAASTWSTSSGQLTIQSGSGTVSLGTSTDLTANAALNITSNTTNALTLDSGTTGQVNLGTGASAKTIQIGTTATNTGNTQTVDIGTLNAAGTTNVTIGTGASATGGITIIQGKTSLLLGNATTPTITAETAAGGNLNLGTNAVSNTVQIGTTATNTGNTQTVNIGTLNAAGTTNVTIGTGAGATAGLTILQGKTSLLLGNATTPTITAETAAGGNINIGDNAVNNTIQLGTTSVNTGNTQTIGIGNLAAAGTTNVTIGTTTGATAGTTTVQGITSLILGNATTPTITMQSAGSGAINVGTNAVSNSIQIGTTAVNTGNTQTIGIGNTAAAGTTNVTIGAGSGATAGTTIAQGITSLLLGNAITPTITMQSAGAGAINIGNNAVGNTIQIGTTTTNTGNTQTINVGNLNAAGTTNVVIGTGASATSGSTTLQSKGTLHVGNAVSPTISVQSAASGNINIGDNAVNNTIQIGTTSSNTGNTQNINIGNTNAAGTTNVTIGAGSGATAGTTTLQSKNNLTINTNGITRATFDTSGDLYLGNGISSGTPANFLISGTGSTATGVAGGSVTIQGGNATTGNANGGNLTVTGGTGIGTGVNGLVVLTTPTYSTVTNDANCYTGGALVASSCTISANSVNGSSAVLVGFNTVGQTATLPDPTITTPGRVIYITAANGSNDFTLSVNGGGTGNTIAMRQNTTATMIWNGNDWTAAGASSSTTLQSAYDNTLQSAGGAELVVSHTSATDGLTIRDSSVNPVNGTLLSVQTASAATLLSVNGNVTEYVTDAGAETAGSTSSTFPASTWSAIGGASVSRYTTVGDYIATGQGSVAVTTTATANDGVKNTLSTGLTANNHYNVSFAARLSSGTFTDMNVYYSVDGTTASVACTTAQAIETSVWTKVNCAFAAPASGITSSNAILIRQTTGTARTFYIDNLSVTISADYNLANDGSVDDGTNFGTYWTSVAGSTVTRSTTVGNDASDSAQVVTTGTGQGVRNQLAINPLQNTLYRVTVYAASTTAGFNSFNVSYSRDGGTNFVNCADYNTQTISSSITSFTEVTCYITTDGTAPTSPYVYFTQTDATGRTFYVDTFSITLNSNSTPNVQIGGGLNGGPVTLLTLDRAASAPIASNNDALLGSMYYDTTLGKLQCYEADGWGACGSSPDNIVTISPEYTNAVMHGTGVGTMTSDICSDTLNINDGTSGQPTICGTNETYNFYKWTSPQASAQTYSIYVTYQLPSTFKTFSSGQTSLMGRTDSTNATVQYSVYRNDSSTGLTQCGSTVAVSTGSVSSWQTGIATGAADPSTCGFVAGDSIVFKIDVVASSDANAYVGNLDFRFSNK